MTPDALLKRELIAHTERCGVQPFCLQGARGLGRGEYVVQCASCGWISPPFSVEERTRATYREVLALIGYHVEPIT